MTFGPLIFPTIEGRLLGRVATALDKYSFNYGTRVMLVLVNLVLEEG